jgi:4-aminobutyrate aminotransferase-like enzyme
VLRAIDDEQLMANAAMVGAAFGAAFARLAEAHAWIGDVRGRGLLRGVELVRDRTTRAPAAREAESVQQLLLDGRASWWACAAPITTC